MCLGAVNPRMPPNAPPPNAPATAPCSNATASLSHDVLPKAVVCPSTAPTFCKPSSSALDAALPAPTDAADKLRASIIRGKELACSNVTGIPPVETACRSAALSTLAAFDGSLDNNHISGLYCGTTAPIMREAPPPTTPPIAAAPSRCPTVLSGFSIAVSPAA